MPKIKKQDGEWMVVIQIHQYRYWMEPMPGANSGEFMQFALGLPLFISRAPRDLGDYPDDFIISARVIKTTNPEYSQLREELEFDDRAIRVEYGSGLSFEGNNLF